MSAEFSKIDIQSNDRSLSIGFFGWCFYKAWQWAIVLFPLSAIYTSSCVDGDFASSFLLVGVLVLPYALTIRFADKLSSGSGLRASLSLTWISLGIALVCHLVFADYAVADVISYAFLLVSMWGLHVTWQPYACIIKTLNLVGLRGLISAFILLMFVMFGDPFVKEMLFILPIISLLLLSAHQNFESVTFSFVSKVAAKQETNLLNNAPFWNAFEGLLEGYGLGLVFVSGISDDSMMIVLISTLAVATLILFAGAKFFMMLNSLLRLAVSISVATILVGFSLLVPGGPALASIGCLLFLLGSIQQGIDVRERFIKPEVNFFLFGRRHFIEMFCIPITALCVCLARRADNLSLAYALPSTVAALVFLFVLVLLTSFYYYAVIKNYESFVFTPVKDSAVCEEDEKEVSSARKSNIWLAKVDYLAKETNLSPRQKEVLVFLSYGRTADTIARELYISQSTAKSHIYTIYKKIDVHSQQDLIDLISSIEI